MAVEAIRVEANRGAEWVLDADVSDCFGQIDHDALLSLIERRVSDRSMLELIRAWLRAGVLEDGVVTDPVAGTPQGSPISPQLANIALNRRHRRPRVHGWSSGSTRRRARRRPSGVRCARAEDEAAFRLQDGPIRICRRVVE